MDEGKRFNILFLKFLLKYCETVSFRDEKILIPETINKNAEDFQFDFTRLVEVFMEDNYHDPEDPYKYLGNKAFDEDDILKHLEEEKEKIYGRDNSHK